jgi:hypothetical protein
MLLSKMALKYYVLRVPLFQLGVLKIVKNFGASWFPKEILSQKLLTH